MAEKGIERALELLRYLPRVALNNLRPNPGAAEKNERRGKKAGGHTHGHGNKGSKQRMSYPRIGYEGHGTPFYISIPKEPYYKGHHLRRQYPPLSLAQLQLMVDTARVDTSQQIDLASICNTKLYRFDPIMMHYGVHLTDEGADLFNAKVNIEVQHASEQVIAAVERNGGIITNAYYDIASLYALLDPLKFFKKGKPIPHRKLPPENAVEFYTDPKFRGYLADPEKVAEERFKLAQKYGYIFHDITKDPLFEMFMERKDPRQVFLGLEPGWVVNLRDKVILKPKDELLEEYYKS